MDRDNHLRNLREEQDATLIRRAGELQSKLALHTVPVAFLKGRAEAGNVSEAGTGLLLRLVDRYFILTAGHCVKGWQSADHLAVHVTARRGRFTPCVVNSGFRYGPAQDGDDYGFWELAAFDASTIQANARTFLSEASVEVLTAEDLRERNEWMVLSGYPDAFTTKARGSRTFRLLQYSTLVAGSGSAPRSTLKAAANPTDFADLWVPRTSNVDALAEEPREIDVPALGGASGGGCWYSRARELGDGGWEPSKMKLVGIHTGACKVEESAEGMDPVFTREALIANHLRLIAREYADLREHIGTRWPGLGLSPH